MMTFQRTTILVLIPLLILSGALFLPAEDVETNSTYDRALNLFYEARQFQSLGNEVKALQKYEEAFLLFQKVAQENSKWGLKAKRKIKQVDRDVIKISKEVAQEPIPSEAGSTEGAQEALKRFEEWRTKEKNIRR